MLFLFHLCFLSTEIAYSKVGSQWQLLLAPKWHCTMHLLLNYLSVFDDFKIRVQLTKYCSVIQNRQ